MRHYCLIILLTSFLTTTAQANCFSLDVYGTYKISTNEVIKKYKNELDELCSYEKSSASVMSINMETSPLIVLPRKLQSFGNFSYIGISPISYANDKTVHITIDVVEKEDQSRQFTFMPMPTTTVVDPDHLISSWTEYQKLGLESYIRTNRYPTFKTCPAFHCVYGFEQANLKKYQAIFSNNAEKDKYQLINVLKHDRDPNKRAAAAFILAHINNANELIQILTPSMYDSNSVVRNNVMRVIGETLMRVPNAKFPLSNLEKPLNFPTAADRNKALLILSVLAKNPVNKSYIAAHFGKILIAQLRLNQPNLHDFAYLILKNISNQTYSDEDYASWEIWVNNSRK